MIRRTLLCYSCLPLFLYLLLASESLALCVQARSVSFRSSDPCTNCCPQTHTATFAQLLFCLNPSFFYRLQMQTLSSDLKIDEVIVIVHVRGNVLRTIPGNREKEISRHMPALIINSKGFFSFHGGELPYRHKVIK